MFVDLGVFVDLKVLSYPFMDVSAGYSNITKFTARTLEVVNDMRLINERNSVFECTAQQIALSKIIMKV